MPIHVRTIHIKMLLKIFSTALNQAPFSNRYKVSIENEEKVVYPPKNPINNKERNCGPMPSNRSRISVNKKPIKNEPLALTNKVP